MKYLVVAVWILLGIAAWVPPPVRASPGPELGPSRKAFIDGFLNAAAQSAWPDYRPDAQPLLIEFEGKDGGSAVLVSAAGAPEGFAPVPGLDMPNRRVLWRRGASSAPYVLLPAEPGAPYPRNFNRYQVRDGEGAETALDTMLHELFHWHQNRAFSPWSATGTAPYDDAGALASLTIEHLLLARALSDGARWPETAKDFIALRGARRRARPETIATEDLLERLEGTAQYVNLNSSLPEQGAAARVSRCVNRLMSDLSTANRSARNRYYPSGAAMAMLLDRGERDWKQRVAGGASVFPLLAANLPMSEAESAERVRRVRAVYSFAPLQAESEHLLRDESDERSKILADFKALGRWMVTLTAPPGAERTASYGLSSPTANFDDGWEIHAIEFSSRRFGQSVNLALRQTSVMESLHAPRGDTFRFPLEATAVIKLDGAPWTPSDSSLKFGSLEIEDEHSQLMIRSPGRIRTLGREISVEWEAR